MASSPDPDSGSHPSHHGDSIANASELPLSEDGSLSLICLDLETFPISVFALGDRLVRLDLTGNCISRLPAEIRCLTSLDTLILDNNDLSEDAWSSLAEAEVALPQLRTLWINKNEINDSDTLRLALETITPKLEYLSALGNPGVPLPDKSPSSAYVHFTTALVYSLPSLRFLDSMPITPADRAEAATRGPLLSRRRRGESKKDAPAPAMSADEQWVASAVKAQVEREEDALGQTHTFVGVSRFAYTGKRSEGNRFITDERL